MKAGVVLMIAGTVAAAHWMKWQRHANATSPSFAGTPAASTAPAMSIGSARPLPPTVPNMTAAPAVPPGTRVLNLPTGYAPERAFLPKEWHHPRSLDEALKSNPQLANYLSKEHLELAGMVDFKLGWLPRFHTCLDGRVRSVRYVDVNLQFETSDDEGEWVGRRAEVESGALTDEEQDIVQECVARTFLGLQRPIMDPDHGDHYALKTRVQLPPENDYVYQLIQKVD